MIQPPTTFQTKLFINNEFVEGKNKKTLPVINPSTEQVICEISLAEAEDVQLAIDAAEKAYQQWRFYPARQRSELIRQLADLLNARINEFIALESLDNGKPYFLARTDIEMVVDSLRFFSGCADKVTGKTFATNDAQVLTSYRREPFGVVGLISPWNYPLLMADWKMAPALAAGNTLVIKCSEETPLTMLKLCELIKEVGFPEGVINVVPGLGAVAGDYLTHSPQVQKISFTGSTMVGRKILQASSNSNIKKVHLELGGKSAVIICPDVDLDYAAQNAWDALMTNMGQVCDAGSRLFVHESIYEAICQRLVDLSKKVVIGDAFTKNVNFGPLINKAQFERVLGYIHHGKETEKLDLLLGGSRFGEKGYFVQPTVFRNVPDSSKLACEEIFGPVLCVMTPWKTLDEVIQRANCTKYGLAAYVFSQDQNKCEKLVQNLLAGSVYVNMLGLASPHVPFGGYKESGFGRDNGEEAVLEYTQIKSVYQYFGEPGL